MTNQAYKDEIVWIIGASSGIGHALAKELAGQGAILALSARSQVDLDQLQQALGTQHKVFCLDITDADMTARTAQAIRSCFGRIDRVVFLAALYTPMQTDQLQLPVVKKIIDTNLTGAFHVTQAVLPILQDQSGPSQLALCGSVAGYTGLPGGQPYSATKAAIINLAESLYAEWAGKIDIKLINPGFVRTALTDKNTFEMPMIVEADQAAREIAEGLRSAQFEIHFPKLFTFFLKFIRILPYRIAFWITRKIKP
jgi:short-subunit dehydrogenase